MRILVFGAGVLGCNLADDLYVKGKDVTLLARGKWGSYIRENGLKIYRYLGKKTDHKIRVISELESNDRYDVIFVVLRYSQLDDIIPVLRNNVSENIVFIGNNVRPKYYRGLLSDKNVMFGFCSYAGHREADHVSSIGLKRVTMGQLREDKDNKSFIDELFKNSGFKASYEDNMEDWLLCHCAAVMPIAFACYHTDGDLKKIRNDTEYLNKIMDATIEAYTILEDTGHEILPESDKGYKKDSFKKTFLPFYRIICSTKLGKMCTSDHALNAADEMKALNEGIKEYIGTPETWKELEDGTKDYLK